MPMSNGDYGKEIILDIYECSTEKFNRKGLEEYFNTLCDLIKMEKCDLHFWDYQDNPEAYEKAEWHLKGTSAIQFIKTSNVTVHTLDDAKRIYLNIFSCKDFDENVAAKFTADFFKGEIKNQAVLRRI